MTHGESVRGLEDLEREQKMVPIHLVSVCNGSQDGEERSGLPETTGSHSTDILRHYVNTYTFELQVTIVDHRCEVVTSCT